MAEPGNSWPGNSGPGNSAPGNGSSGNTEPGNREPGNEPDGLERLLALLGPRVDEARSLFEDLTARWRGDAVRVGEGTKQRVQELGRDAGLATRAELDELELRVAQLEHRLRLLEND
jgi:hypothetical protein